jgi:hypothetical protein
VKDDTIPKLKIRPSPANRHRIAADIMTALVQRYGNAAPTPNECKPLAKAAYLYADALMIEGALWDEKIT